MAFSEAGTIFLLSTNANPSTAFGLPVVVMIVLSGSVLGHSRWPPFAGRSEIPGGTQRHDLVIASFPSPYRWLGKLNTRKLLNLCT